MSKVLKLTNPLLILKISFGCPFVISKLIVSIFIFLNGTLNEYFAIIRSNFTLNFYRNMILLACLNMILVVLLLTSKHFNG
jgi:hypothetical protein